VYYLVLLHGPPDDDPAGEPRTEADHEPFIDSLIARNRVLLGGRFPQPFQADVWAAYVLRCDTQNDAQAIARADPLAATRTVSVLPWDLVAINTGAIDEDLLVTPQDVPPSSSSD
jgi:uncharacterized protein YciI